MDGFIDYDKVTYLPQPIDRVKFYMHDTKVNSHLTRILGVNGEYTFLLQAIHTTAINNNENTNTNIKKAISANDCVEKCKNVLGLKINEIAKLLNISRATLDLHRNGANIKDMETYNKLYNFMANVEQHYGTSLQNNSRNVLIDGKTLVRHLFEKNEDLNQVFPILELLSDKSQGISVSSIEYEPTKLMKRTGHIGKFV